jgi:hypothetical protein
MLAAARAAGAARGADAGGGEATRSAHSAGGGEAGAAGGEAGGENGARRGLTAWRAAVRVQGAFRGHLERVALLVRQRGRPPSDLPGQLALLAHAVAATPGTLQLFKRLAARDSRRSLRG